MTVYFEEEGAYQLPFDCRNLAEKVIAEAVDYEQCPYETEVNLLLTMNEEIREMNRQFREIDRATDVLSLSLIHICISLCLDWMYSHSISEEGLQQILWNI